MPTPSYLSVAFHPSQFILISVDISPLPVFCNQAQVDILCE